MRIHHIILTIALFVTITFASVPSYAIGFNEALSSAYTKNPALQSMRESLKATDEAMPTAISGWLPDISLSHQRGKRDTEQGTSQTDKIIDTKSIDLTQPLFRGGQTIASMKSARNSILSARAELQNIEQQVLLESVTAYMDIVRDQKVLELSENNIVVLEEHLEATKERFSLGEVTKTDVAQAEASLANAISERINAQGALESSRATYRRIIGEEPVELEIIENPITIKASLKEIIDISLKENPSIKVIEYDKFAAQNNISIEKAKLLPSVDFVASKQKQVGALFSSSDIETETLAFNLSVPLYQTGSEYSRIRQSKFTLGRLKYDLMDQQNRVKESVIKAYNDFQVARASIQSNEAVVEASEIALEGIEQEAKVGSRTTLDVLDAEQDLFEAKANLIRSKRDEIVSSYTLLAQVGRLNAKELGLEVEIYDPRKNYNKRKYQIIGF